MTFIGNAARLATDANGALPAPAGKLRGAFRRLFASDWTERWMVVVNGHATGTLSRDARGLQLSWFDRDGPALSGICLDANAALADLHREIGGALNVEPRRIAFLSIGD